MAEKAPNTIRVDNCGSLKKITATYSTTDIDDNDYWTSGISSALDWDVHIGTEGPNDCTVDSYTASTGKFVFASVGSVTGRFIVWCKGY